MNDLRCYVSGRPIEDDDMFYLVSMSKDVDRVFIVHKQCIDMVKGDAVVAILVERVN